MTAAVVVAGEALIDLVPGSDGALTPHVGGGPFNTARAAARLGAPTAFVGAISEDRFGDQIAAALAGDGVQLAASLRTPRPSTLALAELNAAGAASYRFYIAGTSAEALTPEIALAATPAEVSALHVGSLGLILQPLASAVEALVTQWAGQALVMADPNVRPAMVKDLPDYRARPARIIAAADVVKVSDDDLQVLAPGQSPEAAARALLDQGPKLVLLTLGSRGAVALGAFGARAAASPPVEVVDTIGAGDIFSGAWLARWLELGASLDDAAAVAEATDYACRAATLSCTRPGASPPTRAEMAALTAA